MTSTTLRALLAAYTDRQDGALSLRMRTLIEEIARQIDAGADAGSGVPHYIGRGVGGSQNAVTVLTGRNLAAIEQYSTIAFQPIYANTGPVTCAIDSVAEIEITSPTGGSLAADEFHPAKFYQLIALGAPINELRIMYGW